MVYISCMSTLPRGLFSIYIRMKKLFTNQGRFKHNLNIEIFGLSNCKNIKNQVQIQHMLRPKVPNVKK